MRSACAPGILVSMPSSVDAIGWASSLTLVLTIGAQVYKQWHDDTSAGVSPWLFVGEAIASTGFLAYAVLIENWVFVATNAMLAVYAFVGLAIYARHVRRGRAG
jgi:uncharacterized protein with PQ loop repeat